MKFEIEVEVPDGYEPIAYRTPLSGEWIAGSEGPRRADMYDLAEPWLVLQERQLNYEDFVAVSVMGTVVRVDSDALIRIGPQMHTSREIPDLIGAIQAAADHVDRVDAQKAANDADRK